MIYIRDVHESNGPFLRWVLKKNSEMAFSSFFFLGPIKKEYPVNTWLANTFNRISGHDITYLFSLTHFVFIMIWVEVWCYFCSKCVYFSSLFVLIFGYFDLRFYMQSIP